MLNHLEGEHYPTLTFPIFFCGDNRSPNKLNIKFMAKGKASGKRVNISVMIKMVGNVRACYFFTFVRRQVFCLSRNDLKGFLDVSCVGFLCKF